MRAEAEETRVNLRRPRVQTADASNNPSATGGFSLTNTHVITMPFGTRRRYAERGFYYLHQAFAHTDARSPPQVDGKLLVSHTPVPPWPRPRWSHGSRLALTHTVHPVPATPVAPRPAG